MLNIFYYIACLPSYLVFILQARRNCRMREDFLAWCDKYKRFIIGKSMYGSFVYLMGRFPEYRAVLYWRMSFMPRHILGLILRPRYVKLSSPHAIGGG